MGLLSRAAGIVRSVPGGALPASALELSERVLGAAESVAVRILADRLAAHGRLALPASPTALATAPEPETPAGILQGLLARSLQSNTAKGTEDYHVALLRQLVPDEARILATLATGVVSPVVSVLRRGSGETLVANASLIGRTAAITLPSQTPAYVTHLLDLGLVEIGEEDSSAGLDYELVLAERDVRDALRAGAMGKVPAKVIRRTVRISDAGRDLWAAAQS